MLPSFICIGAQRAGTTWLHNCLSVHPQVCMPRKKETHFFYSQFDKGLDWYESQFAHCEENAVVGEVCPNYMYHRDALQHIYEMLPSIQLLIILRNPIERAFSAFNLFRQERYQGDDFRQALESDRRLVDMGMYYSHLETVYEFFSPDQLKVLIYDDLQQQPKRFMQEVYRYIGVRDDYVPETVGKRYNRAVFPRTQAFIYGIGLGGIIERVRQTSLGDKIRNRGVGAGCSDEQISVQDREYLIGHYRQDIESLEKLLNRSLSEWQEL